MANNQQLLLGEGAGGGIPNYIEEVFSTYLYTGNGSTQTITNNIDLSTKGGLVWIKQRNAANNHALFDTSRGTNKLLYSNTTSAQVDSVVSYSDNTLTAFNANGFTLGNDPNLQVVNTSPNTYASWTFREQPKFFDVVTYTGDGTSSQTINHNLGASPGCIITKRTDSTGNWTTWHRSFADTKTYIYLNTTAASVNVPSADAMTVSSTSFTVGTNQVFGNGSGFVYVAYIFAHDAGGFGLSGTDNVISCGSTSGAKVTLGWEPQWILYRSSNFTDDWQIVDNMRGLPVGAVAQVLKPNTSGAETTTSNSITLAADGFTLGAIAGTAIYIAIRRGPMKVPTVGTSVYNGIVRTGTSATATISGAGFPPDFALTKHKDGAGNSYSLTDRLRGAGSSTSVLNTNNTNAEQSGTTDVTSFTMDGAVVGTNGTVNYTGYSYINWFFKRAPGFFDVVCYTGTGSATTFSHNLSAVPEMMIVKRRDSVGVWRVYHQNLGATKNIRLNDTATPETDSVIWNDTAPTSSVFTVGTNANVNASSGTYVAYLFATCAGVSKVGSYTGNGSSQTIACGFTAGSRFVMIKRTDSTGDWYVWDSARGIVAGNDPHLSLNDTAAEVTTDDSVDTDNSGFIVNQVAATNVNVSSATYIFLAIA